MAKTCSCPGCDYPQFGGGYCRNHQWKREDKKPTGLRQFSKKRAAINVDYNKESRKFKEDNPFCRVNADGCTGKATEVHHKKGRGKYLMDKTTWLSCCHNCHRKIEENPDWAKENRFSESRLSKT